LPLSPGTRVGSDDITASIGAGGMLLADVDGTMLVPVT
jgi:hypothetical protein